MRVDRSRSLVLVDAGAAPGCLLGGGGGGGKWQNASLSTAPALKSRSDGGGGGGGGRGTPTHLFRPKFFWWQKYHNRVGVSSSPYVTELTSKTKIMGGGGGNCPPATP